MSRQSSARRRQDNSDIEGSIDVEIESIFSPDTDIQSGVTSPTTAVTEVSTDVPFAAPPPYTPEARTPLRSRLSTPKLPAVYLSADRSPSRPGSSPNGDRSRNSPAPNILIVDSSPARSGALTSSPCDSPRPEDYAEQYPSLQIAEEEQPVNNTVDSEAANVQEDLRPIETDLDRASPDPGIRVMDTKTKVLIFLGGFVVVVAFVTALLVDSAHKINEGNVGIYFRHGALVDAVTLPGVHWAAPFVTEVVEISVRPQTDTLKEITAVTKDGIQNSFDGIQVISDVNQAQVIQLVKKFGVNFKRSLIFDRIAEELRRFCANHTIDEVYNTMFLDIVDVVKTNIRLSITRLGLDGITILNLVIPKPNIPQDIAANYKQVKVQWTEQLVATQQQKTEKIKKETESIKAVLDAEREKAVLEISIQKQILQKEGDRKLSDLENEIAKAREENVADIASYKKQKEAEANANLYTKEYVQLEMAKHLSENTKFYFSGQESALGGLMQKLLGS